MSPLELPMPLREVFQRKILLPRQSLVDFPVHKFGTQCIDDARLVSGTALAAGIASHSAVLTPAASAMPLTFPKNAKLSNRKLLASQSCSRPGGPAR